MYLIQMSIIIYVPIEIQTITTPIDVLTGFVRDEGVTKIAVTRQHACTRYVQRIINRFSQMNCFLSCLLKKKKLQDTDTSHSCSD